MKGLRAKYQALSTSSLRFFWPRLGVLLVLFGFVLGLSGQTLQRTPFREEYITWEDFLEEFIAASSGEEETEDDVPAAPDEALVQELEQLHAQPLNVNKLQRDDLLRLPFMDEAAADSLLAYRERKHGYLLTLGELQYVPDLSHTLRRWLSLFLYVGERMPTDRPLQRPNLWREGRHEVLTHFTLPFYRMAGDVKHTAEQAAASTNKYFEGLRWANTTRWQYSCGQQLAYGLTFQKDSGEPFGTRGSHTYPFDHNGFHFLLRPADKPFQIAAGDYQMRWGQGLVVGGSGRQSLSAIASSIPMARPRLSAHASSDEGRYLQGAAATYALPLKASRPLTLHLAAFASYRRMDGRVVGDTLTSFKTDGLHRTLSELSRRRTIGLLVGGAHLALEGRFRQNGIWQVGVGGAWAHYSKVVWPTEKEYNRYWLRGQNAAGASVDYTLRYKRWSAQGELAFDREGHPATIHTLRRHYGTRGAWYMQLRALSPRYVSPYGSTLAATTASHLQNELALVLGGRYLPVERVLLEGYVQGYRWPRPMYRISVPSGGVEGQVRATFSLSGGTAGYGDNDLLVQYRLRTKQRDVTGTDLQENIGTHKFRLQWNTHFGSVNFHLIGDGTAFCSQTAAAQWGGMLSSRVEWKKGKTPLPYDRSLSARAAAKREGIKDLVKVGGLLSLYSSQSYEARLSAYSPHLRHAASSLSFQHSGLACTLMAEYSPLRWLQMGVQGNYQHLFHGDTFGSGLTAVNSSSRFALLLEARLVF